MGKEPVIIYEDDDMLAINKPAGLMAHPDGHSEDMTVSDWTLRRYPGTEDVGEPLKLANGEIIKRPGIVHRLDRDTSGVMLIAKTHEAFLKLKEQFQGRDVKKTYNALVYGVMPEKEGTIDLPIGRSQADFRKRSAERGARGELRPSVTDYRVLGESGDGAYSFIELIPHTGRTHQIRVHLKALQRPVVCDALYAPRRICLNPPGRLALHARMISFIVPGGSELTIEAPLPEDLAAVLETLGLSKKERKA
jgi:23S rRNA pseudouridine1911/1915/1917 synthase